MAKEPAVKYVTVTSPTQIRPPKPCECGCGGRPRHRVKKTMPQWETDEGVPVFWPTKLSSLERAKHRASLEEFDKDLQDWRVRAEWDEPHFLAACLRDHQNNRIWDDLEAARAQLGELDPEDIQELMVACLEAQKRPGRAEGNDGAASKTTSSDKPSGTSPSEPDTDTPTDT